MASNAHRADLIADKIRSLPADKIGEVDDFVEFLRQRAVQRQPGESLHGLWADLDIDITAEDIAEVRREMWGGFPREDI